MLEIREGKDMESLTLPKRFRKRMEDIMGEDRRVDVSISIRGVADPDGEAEWLGEWKSGAVEKGGRGA